MKLLKSAALGLAALAFASCGERQAEEAVAPDDPESRAAAPEAKPALWRTGDADTAVYLFGAVHVLPPALDWQTPALTAALDEAKAVYFETDLDPDLQALQQSIVQLGFYPPAETLSDHLSAEDRAVFSEAVRKLGLPAAQLETMRPWLAALQIADAIVAKAGYDLNSGVERKLSPLARAAGKEIRKLETVEQQLMVFADLPEEVQIRFLMDGVRQIENEQDMLDSMVALWATGDVEELNRLMIEQDLAEMPAIYDALLVRRNADWTKQLDALIKSEPGAFLVAVGAAHLAGKDSVLEMLKPLGYQIERIQ